MFYKNFTKEQVVSCAIDSYRGVSTNEKFSAEERKETINEVINDLAKDYRRNKHMIFEILEATLDEILPEKTNEFIMFADVRNFKFGQTMRFKVSNKHVKAVAVALGGTVTRTRMDHSYVTIQAENIQVKVYEELLNIKIGVVDFNELVNLCAEAIIEEINNRIYQLVMDTYSNLPTPNKVSAAGIDAAELSRLVQIVDSYGSAVIYGTKRGLAELTETITPAWATDSDKNDIRERGYLGKWKGTPVYEIKNVVTDATNEKFAYDDAYLFIFPQGKESYIKVFYEGEAFIKDQENADWTVDYDIAKRVGMAILVNNHIAIYKNTNFSE